MISSVVTKYLYPNIEKSLGNKQLQRKFMTVVTSYIDRNSSKLSTAGPSKRPIFSDKDRSIVFDMFGVDINELKKVLKTSNYINTSWKIVMDPFNLVMMMMIRYCKLHKLEELNRYCVMYLTLSMYPSLHYKYFKYEPNEAIMQYTINNLSAKYKIKNSGTIMNALVETTITSDTTYSKNIAEGNDKQLTDYINAYKTRMNSMMKKIRDAFEKNYRDGKYLNQETDNESEDNFQRSDSNSYLITRIVDKVYLNLSVHGPDMKMVQIVSKMNEVSVNETRNTVIKLCHEKKESENIKGLCEAILYLFLFGGENRIEDLSGNTFLLFCLDVYKKSNTTDENIIKIKTILDNWIKKYSVAYKNTQRVATLNSFRRALFTFFVLTIQKSA